MSSRVEGMPHGQHTPACPLFLGRGQTVDQLWDTCSCKLTQALASTQWVVCVCGGGG
jgi:hypothetical protein